MSLRDLDIQDEYRSDRYDLIRDFYIPCLENATVYKRAVGFFSSTSMAAAAKGLTALIRSGGKMQLVASPCLSQDDAEAIAKGLRQREEVIASAILRELNREFEQIVTDRLACLAWLLGQGLLEIKLAVANNISQQGIYHEKLGIFADASENIAAFTSSANESSSALIDNFECIDVFCSWRSGVSNRVLRKAENFQRLWDNDTPNVDVIGFPEAAARSLLRLRPERPPEGEPGIKKARKSWTLAEQGGSYRINRHEISQPEPDEPGPDKLQVKNAVGEILNPETLSAGEKEALAFAFIAGLNLASGTAAPLIMDTPFGHLDTDHQKNLINSLPDIPSQVIVLATDRDFPDSLLKGVRPHVAGILKIRRLGATEDASTVEVEE